MRLYHLSPSRNRASIATEGLRLSDSPSKYVWFFADYETAERFASKSWGASREVDVWEANLAGFEVLPDPHPGFDGVPTFVVASPVPVERIALARAA